MRGENSWFYWYTINDNRSYDRFTREETYGHPLKGGRFILNAKDTEKGESPSWTARVFGSGRTLFYFSWGFLKSFCHISLRLSPPGNDNEPITFSIALPYLFSFWVGLPLPKKWQISGHDARDFGLSFHHGCLWWSCWENEMEHNYGPKGDPWWQHGNIDFGEIVFGKYKCDHEEIGEPFKLVIPMVEGPYEVDVQRERYTWTWSRWPWAKTRESYDIRADGVKGIPFPGKGENSWDCGDDGLWGMGVDGDKNNAQIVAAVVESVLETRLKYGGEQCMREAYVRAPVEPSETPPSTPMQAVAGSSGQKVSGGRHE